MSGNIEKVLELGGGERKVPDAREEAGLANASKRGRDVGEEKGVHQKWGIAHDI